MGLHHWGLIFLAVLAGYVLHSKRPLGLPVIG